MGSSRTSYEIAGSVLAALPIDSAVIVAYSGGLDSTVLLHLLANAPNVRTRGLRALHVHHGLNADADHWARHCVANAADLGVPCAVIKVTVEDSGLGVEGEARKQRYAALENACRDGEIVVTAHHADDQAETVLARLARGSGPAALQGILPRVFWPHGGLCRPMLQVPRSALMAYANAHGLHWLDDPMNADPDLERGYLRQSVLPPLTKRWPEFAIAASRSASLLQDALHTDETRTRTELAMRQTPDAAVLDLCGIDAVPDSRLLNVLRHWLDTLGWHKPPARWFDELLRQLRLGVPALHLAHQDLHVHRYRHALFAERAYAPLDWPPTWDGSEALDIDAGHRLTSDRAFASPLIVRRRTGGERVRLHANARAQELRDLFQRSGIGPWRRDVPLLFEGEHLIAVSDWFVSDRFREVTGNARLRLRNNADSPIA